MVNVCVKIIFLSYLSICNDVKNDGSDDDGQASFLWVGIPESFWYQIHDALVDERFHEDK